MSKTTYKDAGVDLDRYAESMRRLPKLMAGTFSDRVLRLDGGFAGLFRLFNGENRYEDPVLVSCTDGVGTKLKLAYAAGRHDTVGIDLVAMSVNDAVCCGAKPLFFLDYVAMQKDDPDLLEQIVSGIAAGCRESECALLGGETAILSDIYRPGEYDLAGFCVAVAERKDIIDGKAIRPGDAILGIASSGPHSNGFSLIRRIVFDLAGLEPDSFVEVLDNTVAGALLEPTRLYAKPVASLLRRFGPNTGIRGIAHITGGGLEENLGRIVPAGTKPRIDRGAWPVPEIFRWLQTLGSVEFTEMERVFNMGIGLALVVDPDRKAEMLAAVGELGLDAWEIGAIIR
ncbi:MAG TPA: phosphoribosylformylglycinamidine cyclo-ligase [Planctomycetaceae bacterium]|nr:phosphoribosylformylglycinamidine cyclo-ligase [Planctomycetaceae bacterium]